LAAAPTHQNNEMRFETSETNLLKQPTRPQVLIASEIRLYRTGLETILRTDGRLNVRASCDDVASACTVIRQGRIDVLLLDTGITGGLKFVEQIKSTQQNLKIIALGLTETAEDILPYIETGVAGYVCREGAVEDVVQAVISALSGELICSCVIAAALQRRVTRLASRRTESHFLIVSQLTRREQQIAKSLELGMSNKQIASSLHITVSTVKNHVHSVL